MILIGLLLAALVCLALGLVLASAAWLIASLAVSALAAVVLWSVRGKLIGRADPPAAGQDAAPTEDGVWVVDGRPRFHRADCALLKGLDAERISAEQAIEDGFTGCPECAPEVAVPAGDAGSGAGPEAASRDADRVWVVDGRPRYHLQDCMIISGKVAEAVARSQAVEDGFLACSLCEPDAARVPAAG